MPRVFWIPVEGTGRMGICPHPSGGESLDGEMARLHEEGVTQLVCLLTDLELEKLELGDKGDVARRHGITLRAFPIDDRNVPKDAPAFGQLVIRVNDALRAGAVVVAHCWGGIGSGLSACAVLCVNGMTPA